MRRGVNIKTLLPNFEILPPKISQLKNFDFCFLQLSQISSQCNKVSLTGKWHCNPQCLPEIVTLHVLGVLWTTNGEKLKWSLSFTQDAAIMMCTERILLWHKITSDRSQSTNDEPVMLHLTRQWPRDQQLIHCFDWNHCTASTQPLH